MRLIEERLETGALLKGYIHDTSQKMEMTFSMPAVVIFPGGSYERCSVRESEPVALAFMARGYNAFTVEYLTGERPLGIRPLLDAAAAVKAVKCNSGRWNVNREKIVTVGFSAGGHLVGWLGNVCGDGKLSEMCGIDPEKSRPAAQVLCYPVITSGEYGHRGSFDMLFGDGEPCCGASLEESVSPLTPPSFIWAGGEDMTVPPVNSLLFAERLARSGVKYELHVFSKGGHGLSLALEYTARPEKYVESWFAMCVEFLDELFKTMKK